MQHGGVLLGMLAAAFAGRGRRFGSLRAWQIGGCLLSALMLAGLVAAAFVGPAWPFKATVVALGAANGAFSIAAIASMMRLASEGRHAREGVRMGLWGAAQAVAFGLGGLVGTGASDLARWLIGSPAPAYAAVFGFEALLFVAAAVLAAMACPCQSTVPRSGADRPQIMRSRLVLPAPFSPCTRSIWPASTEAETSLNSRRDPRTHCSSSSSRALIAIRECLRTQHVVNYADTLRMAICLHPQPLGIHRPPSRQLRANPMRS